MDRRRVGIAVPLTGVAGCSLQRRAGFPLTRGLIYSRPLPARRECFFAKRKKFLRPIAGANARSCPILLKIRPLLYGNCTPPCKEVDSVNDTVEREILSDRGLGDARLVQLKPGRPGPCIFLVPGGGGRVEGFLELANLLDTPMPLFAIEARGVDGASDPDHDMAKMVRHYIDRLQTVQPNGPYFLLGHSAGGAVVFEMAQCILGIQERVACLILLDTPLPRGYRSPRFYLANLGPRLHTHLERIMSESSTQNINYYIGRLRRRWRGLRNIPPDLMSGPKAARVARATSMMMSQWRPEFYPGRLTLFCYAGRKLWTLYQNRVAELETHFLAGDHANMVNQPYVSSLARALSACLEKAS